MSPRAACRLDALRFEQVFDYTAGKADWLAHALPTEGTAAAIPRAKDVLREDVVTCRLDDAAGEVRARVEESPYGFAFAVSAEGCLLGRVRRSKLDCHPETRIEEIMEAGPSTVRADSALDSLVERLRGRELRTAVVTAPTGRLLGVLTRADAERRLAGR